MTKTTFQPLMTDTQKLKFPRSEAIEVAKEICGCLKSLTARIKVAGSLRRGKALVGDIEILYVPLFNLERDGLFGSKEVNLVDRWLEKALRDGLIVKRMNTKGSSSWGERNKLAIHLASGIPVDFFAASESSWFNYLVCRTGGSANNVLIASSARKRGLMWHPYDSGFTDAHGNHFRVNSEEDVYRLAGLPYKEPHQRP